MLLSVLSGAPAMTSATLSLLLFVGFGKEAACLAATSPQSTLQITPSHLTDMSAPATILVTGLRGTPRITVSDLQYVDVSQPTISGSAAAFTVTRIAAGQATITVSDGSGDSVTIPILNTPCLPEPPHIKLLSEQVSFAAGAHEPVRSTTVLFESGLRASEGAANEASSFTMRLIGTDGSIVTGTNLSPLQSSDVNHGLAAPDKGEVLSSIAPPLSRNVRYRVQLVRQPCEDSSVVGSFST